MTPSTEGRDTGAPGFVREIADRYPFGGVMTFDRDLRYLSAGGRGFEKLELDPSELVGRTVREALPAPTAEILEPLFRDALRGEEGRIRVPFAGRVYDCWTAPRLGEDGEVEGGLIVTWDVTEFARGQEELDLVRRAVAELPVGLTIADARADDCPLIFVNDGFLDLTGYERREVLGRNCRFLQGDDTDPAHAREIAEALEEGRAVQVTLLNHRKNGEPFWNRVSIYPVRSRRGTLTHFVGIQEDVSEQRRLGMQLHLTRRLSALGELAGGVAHDIRNVLMGAGGILEMTLAEADLDPAVAEELAEARRILDRGASVTGRLLAFAREEVLDHGDIELRSALRERAGFLRRVLRSDVAVEVSSPYEPVWIRGDEGQLDQVFLNLARNAEDAMPEGGTLTFSLVADPTALDPFPTPPAEDGAWVRLSVADTGIGIPPDIIERVFDPFFTTKGESGGTGLGLASVYGTVAKMGGEVFIDSTPGEGTCVHIALPRRQPPGARPSTSHHPEALDIGPAEILLVEDEPAVRRVCRRALERAGHTVHEAADGEQGMRQLGEHVERLGLLVADAVIPGGSGIRIAEALYERRPDVPVILMSGYTDEEVDRGRIGARLAFLAKPFTVEQFLRKVEAALA